MQIATRSLPFEMPKYSLTGDILSYQRCGLQYRYYNGSSLPPSRPVQLWTGEFIHGLMEEAYLYWNQYTQPFPWPCNPTPYPVPPTLPARADYDIGVMGDRVEARLVAAGKLPRSGLARQFAYNRVEAAIRVLAPHLFPLVTSVEKRISGTRKLLPPIITGAQNARSDRYELTGVADVISNVKLQQHVGNPIVELVQSVIANLTEEFDIIVDYKSSRRPDTGSTEWLHHDWQVQTYAWLRSEQPNSVPVSAGILVYIDELFPSATELIELKDDIAKGQTDVTPPTGSQDYYELYRWQSGLPIPTFTDAFLLKRAIRVVNVNTTAINTAVAAIDNVVTQIEGCALSENTSGDIMSNWPKTGHDRDCDACDFRRFCTNTARHRANPALPRTPLIPTAPG